MRPRGACILTTDGSLSKKIDKAVFPGEQGGPHVHVFAALATTFKIAQSKAFADLQKKIIKNCAVLTARLKERGMRIPFGGTDTHLLNLDCKTIIGPDGTTLTGDMAARILDVAGLVLNRNTIPGDKTALHASGIRFGTPWMTQRGLNEKDMTDLADIIADILEATIPYSVETNHGFSRRAKVDFMVLEDAKIKVRKLCEKAGADLQYNKTGYPHFFYLDDKLQTNAPLATLNIKGTSLRQFVTYCFSSDVDKLEPDQNQKTSLSTPAGLVEGAIEFTKSAEYRFSFPSEKFGLAATFLRDLADGYIAFDGTLSIRIPGTITVEEDLTNHPVSSEEPALISRKPYFIGQTDHPAEPLPSFQWVEKGKEGLKRTPLYEAHQKLGAKIIPFAGWEMPVWYSSVVEEHLACRQAAGLFDVTHMGVFQAEGPKQPCSLKLCAPMTSVCFRLVSLVILTFWILKPT